MTYIEECVRHKLEEIVKLFGVLEYNKVLHQQRNINKYTSILELRLIKEEMTNKIMLNKFMEPLILDDFLYETSSFEYKNDDLIPDRTKVNSRIEIIELIKDSGIYDQRAVWFNIVHNGNIVDLKTLNQDALRNYFRDDIIIYAILNNLEIPYVDIKADSNLNIRGDKLLVDTDGVFDKIFNTVETDFIRRKLRQSWF